MAVSVVTSLQQISDSNGDPVSGATVTVYDAGTTTPKSLFSNAGLSVAAANPIVCDAFGRHDMMYFAAGTYKIVVKTSGGSTLYTRDNIDPSVPLGSGALAIANGGTGATTAGGARTNLGVPSQTEVDDIASDVAALQSSLNAISGVPTGRLTPSTGVPVISSDVTSSTNIYYTPYVGNQIPLWNGTQFVLNTYTETTLALVSNHLLNTIYDCFVTLDGSTIRLVTGPAWNTSTAGSGARGSGAGTTELSRQGGILVNANSMTARYGATTLTVPALQGTYVGSIFIDGTAGQVTCHTSVGQSRKFGVWNAYNRRPINLVVADSTASWSYGSATVRAANGASANSLTTFNGLSEEWVNIHRMQTVVITGNGSVGVGLNSTSAYATNCRVGSFNATGTFPIHSFLAVPPGIGINTISALESAATSTTFNGGVDDMNMPAQWMG